MQVLAATVLLTLLLVTPTSEAQTAAENAATCFLSSITKDESLALARIHVIALARSSALAPLLSVREGAEQRVNKDVVRVYEALLFDRCSKQAEEAIATHGPAGLQAAFFALGKKASDDVNLTPEMIAEVARILEGIDRERLLRLLSKAPR